MSDSFNKTFQSLYQFNLTHHLLPAPTFRIDTPADASPLFLSVVQTIKEGNILDDTAMHEAESVIQKLIEVVKKPFTATHLLSMIVPTPNRSPAGFCEAMLTLLTSGHQSLEALSLQLLRHCLSHIPRESHLAFIRTGFFTQLAPTIERIANMMIPESHADFLRSILLCARDCLPEPIQRLPRVSHLPIDSIRQIVFDQLLQPVGPYISWCCENRLALEAATLDLSRLESLLLVFLQLSVFHEQTLRFVFSLPICATFTQILHSIEHDQARYAFRDGLHSFTRRCQDANPIVMKRWKAVLRGLNEEGLADDLETLRF